FDEATRKIAMIAQLHQRLYREGDVESLAFDAFLSEICTDLAAMIGSDVRITCEARPCRLSVDQAVPLALVVNELITNAAKHAYPDGAAGEVQVTCEAAAREVTVTVADRGAPLPTAFNAS